MRSGWTRPRPRRSGSPPAAWGPTRSGWCSPPGIPGAELAGLPELEVAGLVAEDARALFDSALAGPLDEQVADLIVAETRGNPLALLELPEGLSPAELAGGFGLPGAASPTGGIEHAVGRQLAGWRAETRRLVLLAAADPSGDRALVWRAAGRLGIPVRAASRPRTRNWSSSAAGSGSGTRSPAPPSTSPLRCASAGRRTRPWRRRPIRSPTRTAGRGIGPRPRPDRTRRSPPTWSPRPGGRRLAAVWPPRRRSSSARSR